ncbi:MAG: LppA family lipoprotein [Mycobacteriales bacterium]
MSPLVVDSGFGAAETVVDQPGQHEIVLQGERGSRLRFGTLSNASLALETGCHLPAAVAASPSPG